VENHYSCREGNQHVLPWGEVRIGIQSGWVWATLRASEQSSTGAQEMGRLLSCCFSLSVLFWALLSFQSLYRCRICPALFMSFSWGQLDTCDLSHAMLGWCHWQVKIWAKEDLPEMPTALPWSRPIVLVYFGSFASVGSFVWSFIHSQLEKPRGY
jgi:hypothetical protein